MSRVQRFSCLVGALMCLGVPAARAETASACRDQAVIAERAAGIPDGLLLAIGKQESGRYDPLSGSAQPWPWSVNRDGESRIFETKEEAVAYVTAAQREGSQSIDVGCFQINLKYHPGAFASLDDAFDPAANAAYAAQFLGELQQRSSSWETAVGDYHSATAIFGEPYREAVLALWHGLSPTVAVAVDAPDARMSMRPTRIVMGIRIFEPAVRQVADNEPVQRALPIRPAVAHGRRIPMVAPRPVKGLPRVITPDT